MCANISHKYAMIDIHRNFDTRLGVVDAMDGIKSPKGDKVLHHGVWIDGIFSPDGDSYHFDGDWYPLGATSYDEMEATNQHLQEQLVRQKKRVSKQERENNNVANALVAVVVTAMLFWPHGVFGISIVDQMSAECPTEGNLIWDEGECQEWRKDGEASAFLIVIGGLLIIGLINKGPNTQKKSPNIPPKLNEGEE